MDWLRNNYEKAILIVASLVLLACCGLIISQALSFSERFAGRDSSQAPNNTIKALPADLLRTALEKVKAPQNWLGHDGSLLVSRPYVLIDGTLVDPLEGNKNLHEPIKNSWLIKYDLPYWESDIKQQDADADGFSNLEEYLAGSDPRDKNSVPPFYTKLRLVRFISKPFRLIFTGTPDDGQTFTINTKDRGTKTQFLELGQMIAGTSYKIVSYEKKTERRNEIDFDASTLTLENAQTGQKIVLVANKEANDPTSFAEFHYLYNNSKFTVKKDDEFSLPPESDRQYKLIDISEKEAVIQDQKTREQHKVPPA
ncbi:MAG TPA: Amuc_1099 family pilus-like system protein [Terrimicrobiaceae bacterium]